MSTHYIHCFVFGADRSAGQEGKGKAAETDDDDLEDEDSAETSAKPIRTTFELNETLYAEADLEDTDTVYLWLGVSTTSPSIYALSSFSRPTLCFPTRCKKP